MELGLLNLRRINHHKVIIWYDYAKGYYVYMIWFWFCLSKKKYDSDFDVVLGAGISTEDLSKTKDSVAEVKQVDKVVD
jgi:hypothetical protein